MSWLKALGFVSLYGTVVVRPLKYESNQVGEIMSFSELESSPGRVKPVLQNWSSSLGWAESFFFSPFELESNPGGVKSVFVKVR